MWKKHNQPDRTTDVCLQYNKPPAKDGRLGKLLQLTYNCACQLPTEQKLPWSIINLKHDEPIIISCAALSQMSISSCHRLHLRAQNIHQETALENTLVGCSGLRVSYLSYSATHVDLKLAAAADFCTTILDKSTGTHPKLLSHFCAQYLRKLEIRNLILQ
jgi:hypothetical protein